MAQPRAARASSPSWPLDIRGSVSRWWAASTAASWRRCGPAISTLSCRPCPTAVRPDCGPYRSPPTRFRWSRRQHHPLRTKRRPQPSSTLAYPWVLPDRDVLLRLRLEALFRVAGLEPPAAQIESDSISFIGAVLRNSDMLSFATSQVMRNEMDGVAPLVIPGLTMTRSAGILYRSSAGDHAGDASADRSDQEAGARTRRQLRCSPSVNQSSEGFNWPLQRPPVQWIAGSGTGFPKLVSRKSKSQPSLACLMCRENIQP